MLRALRSAPSISRYLPLSICSAFVRQEMFEGSWAMPCGRKEKRKKVAPDKVTALGSSGEKEGKLNNNNNHNHNHIRWDGWTEKKKKNHKTRGCSLVNWLYNLPPHLYFCLSTYMLPLLHHIYLCSKSLLPRPPRSYILLPLTLTLPSGPLGRFS